MFKIANVAKNIFLKIWAIFITLAESGWGASLIVSLSVSYLVSSNFDIALSGSVAGCSVGDGRCVISSLDFEVGERTVIDNFGSLARPTVSLYIATSSGEKSKTVGRRVCSRILKKLNNRYLFLINT